MNEHFAKLRALGWQYTVGYSHGHFEARAWGVPFDCVGDRLQRRDVASAGGRDEADALANLVAKVGTRSPLP